MHDLLIRGAEVYDGLGNPPPRVDVAVDKGRISAIGKLNSPANGRSYLALERGPGQVLDPFDR